MFRTELHPQALKNRISLRHSIFTTGSCFSDTIGQALTENKFTVLNNPFGTVYNPLSIHRQISHSLDNRMPDEHGYLQRDDIFLHYDYHSRFAAFSKHSLEELLSSAVSGAHRFLQNTHWLIITYGTAWVYRLKENNRPVANCHKMPDQHFIRELLTEPEIVHSFGELYRKLKSLRPDLQIILTVSPVRHLRDTHELNSVSKAVLRLACHQLCHNYAGVYYFPAYELMLDDLRDYRFYDTDMIHPSREAIQYIWNKFIQSAMDEETRNFIKEWESLRQTLTHKPMFPGSRSHKKLIEATLARLEKVKHLVDVSAEIESLQKQLST
ncbi:MAG: hypothetical protein KatS3mg032_0616 [Cyclobacteriaceae bacterium]|nr:MAG: hypothetical protein KatS3mg032_0616 [Cyclobacteriaceae bacterium]